MRYFRDRHDYKVGVLRKNCPIYGKQFPAGSILVIDRYESSFSGGFDVYVATKIPRSYKGNNPILTLYVYSDVNDMWGKDIFQNEITRKIWFFYAMIGKPQINRLFIPDGKAVDLMRHDCAHKKGSGSRIYDNQINGSLKYNQVTEVAYWANLNDRKSGNASVVASNIRW